MPEPDSSPTPAAVEGSRVVPQEIPEDVRAELDAEAKPKLGPEAQVQRVEPVPEDVLAELDAETRAQVIRPSDDGDRPVALDEDSER